MRKFRFLKKTLPQFLKLSKIHSAIVKDTGQCFHDVTNENLYISRTQLFQKKLWQIFLRKRLLKIMK